MKKRAAITVLDWIAIVAFLSALAVIVLWAHQPN